MRKKRSSGIELLRIVAMAIIVMHHFAVHSHFLFPLEYITFNRFFVQLMTLGGKIGVDIFVLISGYFLIRMEFSLYKLVRLIGQMWFYSLVILGFALYMDISVPNMKRYLLPIVSVNWFAYAYMVLYILHPFINRMLLNMEKLLYVKMLLVMGVMWVACAWGFDAPMQYCNIVWFVFLYSIGAYCRLFGDPEWSHGRNILIGAACLWGGILLYDYWGQESNYIFSLWSKQYAQNSPFVLLVSVSMFMYFKKLPLGCNRGINYVAGTTFGIYLIHDTPVIRGVLWTKWFGNPDYTFSDQLWLIAIGEVVLVFIASACLDACRSYATGLLPHQIIKEKCRSWQSKIDMWLNDKL